MILKPLVSEKSMMRASTGVYTFAVENSITKPEIKKIIHELFNVDVLKVNILNRVGKLKRYKKVSGKRRDVRIALVQINPKQKIEGFEIEVPAEEKSSGTKTSLENKKE